MKYSKLLAICLACIMIISAATAAFADSFNTNNSESIVLGAAQGLDENMTVVRNVEGNRVEVTVYNEAGTILAKSTRIGDSIVVMDYSDPNNPVDITEDLVKEFGVSSEEPSSDEVDEAIRSITWGNWVSHTGTINTHNKTLAQIISWLGSLCSSVPLSILSTVASQIIGSSWPYVTARIRMRTGTDANYQYAQEEVTLWGRNTENGTKHKFYGPELWQQKKSLNRD